MNFTEDWYSEKGCQALADLATRTLDLPGRIIEIGCWEGKSTSAIAQAVSPEFVDAVDTWEGSPGEISADLAAERDVHATFKANTAWIGNVRDHRMGWRDYLKDATPIRFCHIDATHTYEEVSENIRAVWPLIVDGGILCGDDAAHPPVRKAVLDTLDDPINLAAGHVWWIEKGADRQLASLFQAACQTPSDIYEHLPVFHELCVGATKIIELGTRGGVSTIAWLYGLEHQGHLWSVDIDPAPDMTYPHWTFIQGDDLDPAVVGQLPDDADVVFIDTSHAYEDTLAELNVYRWKVKPGGKIVLHDTELRRPGGLLTRQPPFPVKVAVEEFCTEENLTWTNRPNNNGLGVIDIPE